MPQDVQTFRCDYRAKIAPSYRAWLHGGLVAVIGLGLMAMFLTRAEQIQTLQYSAVLLSLLVLNVGEYQIHKHLGHIKRRVGRLFYKRHTGDHHSFFRPVRCAMSRRVIFG